MFVLIDDYSRYMWTVLMKEKSEAFTKFKRFRSLVEQETGERIKVLRTDRGGEFTSKEFKDYCDDAGIERHLTAPYSPQQNGIVERRNRTLLEITRSILKHMDIKTPYESYKGRKPNIEHIRVFGCVGYARITTPHLKKLDDRFKALVHLGTEPGTKAYRLLEPSTRRIIVSRDVMFSEDQRWKWLELEKEVRKDSGVIDFGEVAVQTTTLLIEDTEVESDGEAQREPKSEVISEESSPAALRRSSRVTNKPSYLDDYELLREEDELYETLCEIESERLLMLVNEEPWNYNEAKGLKVWRDACEDEINLGYLPSKCKAIGLK